jgi:hypothetical protein
MIAILAAVSRLDLLGLPFIHHLLSPSKQVFFAAACWALSLRIHRISSLGQAEILAMGLRGTIDVGSFMKKSVVWQNGPQPSG